MLLAFFMIAEGGSPGFFSRKESGASALGYDEELCNAEHLQGTINAVATVERST
jgi:hypothetical protein